MPAPTIQAEAVLRVREVAHHLDCTEQTVYKLIRDEKLRAIRVGRLMRIPESALHEFLNGGE